MVGARRATPAVIIGRSTGAEPTVPVSLSVTCGSPTLKCAAPQCGSVGHTWIRVHPRSTGLRRTSARDFEF